MNNEEFPVLTLNYYVKMADGSCWGIPVAEIATSRADAMKGNFDDDFMRSMYEDTLPLFQQDPDKIGDWAQGNMEWKEVEGVATLLVKPLSSKNYPKDWVNPVKHEVK